MKKMTRTGKFVGKKKYALKWRGKYVEMGLPWTLHDDPEKATLARSIEELLHKAFRVTYEAGNHPRHFHQGYGDIKIVRFAAFEEEVR